MIDACDRVGKTNKINNNTMQYQVFPLDLGLAKASVIRVVKRSMTFRSQVSLASTDSNERLSPGNNSWNKALNVNYILTSSPSG